MSKEKQTTTVDPNDSPTSFKSEHTVGASDSLSHPCSNTPVDGNYSSKGTSSGEGSRRAKAPMSGGDEYEAKPGD